ncbi:hypothetical protein [Ignatzschineria cameli]|uniref:hypothetical protein n=1 Tax=Ignatzschineria cameli TaxID=2182793 RepID=UPI0010576613|nr:hypothetical protein [Ignatzschineria cameli]
MSCRSSLSRISINHAPAVGNHSIAGIVLVFIKADELPILTIAYFHQSHAGNRHRFSFLIPALKMPIGGHALVIRMK